MQKGLAYCGKSSLAIRRTACWRAKNWRYTLSAARKIAGGQRSSRNWDSPKHGGSVLVLETRTPPPGQHAAKRDLCAAWRVWGIGLKSKEVPGGRHCSPPSAVTHNPEAAKLAQKAARRDRRRIWR